MQDADAIIASKTGDTRPDIEHMDEEIWRTIGNMVNLLNEFPSANNWNLWRATASVFYPELEARPLKDVMPEFNILMSASIPYAPWLLIEQCQYVDPHKTLPTPLVDSRTGRIITNSLHKFPLWQLQAHHTTVLLPFCFGKISWFLADVLLAPMPVNTDDERGAYVKVYTNFATSVNHNGGHEQSVGGWVIEYLKHVSRDPDSSMRTVDWSNKEAVFENALNPLINCGRRGIIAATLFVADQGNAIQLMQSDQIHFERNLHLVCVQLVEGFMDLHSAWPLFRPSHRLLSPVLPKRASAASMQASGQH